MHVNESFDYKYRFVCARARARARARAVAASKGTLFAWSTRAPLTSAMAAATVPPSQRTPAMKQPTTLAGSAGNKAAAVSSDGINAHVRK
eukprot:6214342-Pleurochrysis_carterae.AAC.2